jgi:hypothetical protein
MPAAVNAVNAVTLQLALRRSPASSTTSVGLPTLCEMPLTRHAHEKRSALRQFPRLQVSVPPERVPACDPYGR